MQRRSPQSRRAARGWLRTSCPGRSGVQTRGGAAGIWNGQSGARIRRYGQSWRPYFIRSTGLPCVFVWIAASALCPGQASVFPAVEFVAMAGGLVEFAFDAFQHVVATAASGLGAGHGGTMRALAAATDEEQQGFRIGGLGQLSQKMGIENPAGPGLPFDVQSPGNDADEFEFCVGTYIDQTGSGSDLQQFVRFVRQ